MEIKEAISKSKKVPTIAFKTPPPISPGGLGRDNKKFKFITEKPFLTIIKKIKIKGRIEITEKNITKNLKIMSLNIFIF
ncbi:MAG: hypothetical protein NC917_04000 [Candidatus Omnitrophica bacterium]|nr:hypothetical protein [Candidatus Omnitrophota bacterium]